VALDTPWSLSSGAFERLLAILADDRDAAADAYQHLRARVVGLQRWWGAADPEALADVTLDRAAKKLEQGIDVDRAGFGAYVRGVARMVFYEAARQPKHVAIEVEPAVDVPIGDDRPARCLDKCLATLSGDDRQLVLKYYDGGANQIMARRRLARDLGVSPTALRIRTHRIRVRLEQCVGTCLQRP
jgi:DNA-directed RNA polymerase specialized sigma24 family protein